MLEIRLEADQRIAFMERPRPKARDEWVLVRLLSVPMCNEYHAYAQGKPMAGIGHEAAGIVADGARSGRFRPGDRVVVMPQLSCGACPLCLRGEYIHCRQPLDSQAIFGDEAADWTFAQYMLKPARLLVPVPDGYDLDHAAMACCGLGPSFGAAERMGIDHSHVILVSGLGPVGLGAVINCVYRGARVIGLDPVPFRRDLALSLGAEATLDPADDNALARVRELTQGLGVDGAIECSGAVPAQEYCLEATRIKGHVTMVGSSTDKASVHLGGNVLFKGLTIQGSWHYNRSSTQRLMRQIGAVGDQIDRMITHRFPLRQVKQAWETQCAGQCGKVVLQPWA